MKISNCDLKMMCEIVEKVNVVENEVVECPICMDQIDGEKNKVITECGHCFHTSCLMKNVAHNGFGCPYCRDAMAEEPDDNNTDEEYDEFSVDEEDEEPDYTDNVLRGSRWLFQRAEGEELDDEEDTVLDEDEEPERVEVEPRAPVEYIVEKLLQRGVSMADLVKSILIRDHEEYQFHDEFDRADDELFGKFRMIISNYQPPAADLPVSLVEDQAPVVENHDVSAETVLSVREAMNLLNRGPIPRGLVVNSNDPDYRKFKAPCDMFFTVRAL